MSPIVRELIGKWARVDGIVVIVGSGMPVPGFV